MKLWIDCEFNDYLGPLISMALVAEDDTEWYEAVDCDNPSEWVRENVIPVIGRNPISRVEMQQSLKAFLGKFESIHIIADWHEDIQHFCALLTRGPGKVIGTPPLTFEIQDLDCVPDIPHNALSDARAIKKAYLCL